MATQANTLPVLPKKIIVASDGEDVILGNLDSQLQVFSSTDPPTPGESVNVTLPCNPQLGLSIEIVAVNAAVNLDGNGFPISQPGVVNPTVVAAGSRVVATFVQDPALRSGGGCCNGNGSTDGSNLGNGAWIVG